MRLGVAQGEFRWHHHDDEDEFLHIVLGRPPIDLEDRSVELEPNQGFTVPRKVHCRTRAPERIATLMIEGDEAEPIGHGC